MTDPLLLMFSLFAAHFELKSLSHCRNPTEMAIMPIKERIVTNQFSFNYRPVTFAKRGKRQKGANSLMRSSSALIKRMGWQDNPKVAESLTVAREEQISWLNDFPPSQCQAGRKEGLHGDWWTGGVEEVFMSLASGVVTEWVKCLHQFGAITMSKGEDGAWRRGTDWGRREEERPSAYYKLIHFLTHTFKHTHAHTLLVPPAPPPAGRPVYRKAV